MNRHSFVYELTLRLVIGALVMLAPREYLPQWHAPEPPPWIRDVSPGSGVPGPLSVVTTVTDTWL